MWRLWNSLFLFFLLFGTFCFADNLTVNISPENVWPGKCLSVRMASVEGVSAVKAKFLNKEYECFPRGEEFKGIIGLPLEQKPGSYRLTLTVTRNDGSTEEMSKPVELQSVKFASVWFWLKPAKRKLYVKELIQEEWARIERSLLSEDFQQRWKEKFILPVEGPVSMGFGAIEHVNRKRSGQHRGLDLAVPIGTTVVAPNYGKVVFTEKLKAFGGTLVLDHGQGIHSLYFHLSKFLVRIGQEVTKGEKIALSGNSGISSGPHLHWGMSVHNLRVDPLQWTRYAF